MCTEALLCVLPCVQVWDAAGLSSQRPSLTVHDCLKHLQLEDGRLLLWRIANDAIICTVGV